MSTVSISPMISPARVSDTRQAPSHETALRHGPIDVLRMAAVIPVVFYHAGIFSETIAVIGMHALIAAAVVFAATNRTKGSAWQVVTRRATRLGWPWLFFGLFYLAGAFRNHTVEPWMFLIGGSMHLWFVPFIFVVTCCVALASRSGELRPGWVAVMGWSSLAFSLMLIEVLFTPMLRETVPVWQFLDGATAVLVAIAAYVVPQKLGRFGPLFVAGAITLISLPLWMLLRSPGMMWIAPAGVGTLIFFAVRQLPGRSNHVTDFLGRSAFGLYLIHPLIQHYVTLAYSHSMHAKIDQMPIAAVVVCTLITIMASLTIIAVLERTPARRIVL